jgi:hypothetical protein
MQSNILIRFKRLFVAAVILVSVIANSTRVALATSVPIGVYNGPGAVTAHNNFSSWLGSPVTYATDYVDYKGGWQKDFIDSRVWLMEPWGKWVKEAPNRKFVLGLPMLQNSNYGQFDLGTAGAFDTYFINLSQTMVANGLGSSVIRLGYEANCNTIGPWQATDNPAGYVRYFRHIVQTMRSVPGTSFKFDWTACLGLQNGHALTSFASFYPGDDVVDIMGMDVYDVKWMDTSVTHEQRWQYNLSRYMGLQDHKNFALAHGKPVSFPEWGLYKPGDAFAGGGDDPYFIDRMADWIESNNTIYQSYFNLNWGGGVLADFPNGQARYKARFGQVAVLPPADTILPSVAMISPLAGATLSGTTNLQASATDNIGVTRVDFFVDNQLVSGDTAAPYSVSWNTATVANGTHILAAKAYDAAGNVGQSSNVTVNINNYTAPTPTPTPVVDATLPLVTITSPSSGEVLSSQVQIVSSATDNVRVVKMQLYIDGKLKYTTYTNSLTYNWYVKRGSHTVTIKAYDAAGNIGQASVLINKL